MGMMPWYTQDAVVGGFGTSASTAEGIPSEMNYIAEYCQRRGIPTISSTEWAFWKALTVFRLGAINHGVYTRGVAGTAASTKALVAGDSSLALIDRGLSMLDE